MLNWSNERRLSSSKELSKVEMYVYVAPSGLIGRFLGRTIRLRVERFVYVVDRGNALRRVEVAADSLVPDFEVDKRTLQTRLPLNFSEVDRITHRTHNFVLNASRYPSIEFDVESESVGELTGTLQLRGARHSIQCVKKVEGPELVVDCPVSLQAFHVRPFMIWLGLFSERDRVIVQTRVPASALS